MTAAKRKKGKEYTCNRIRPGAVINWHRLFSRHFDHLLLCGCGIRRRAYPVVITTWYCISYTCHWCWWCNDGLFIELIPFVWYRSLIFGFPLRSPLTTMINSTIHRYYIFIVALVKLVVSLSWWTFFFFLKMRCHLTYDSHLLKIASEKEKEQRTFDFDGAYPSSRIVHRISSVRSVTKRGRNACRAEC